MSQVLSRTRIQDIDALRGFALLGILVVNITFVASGFPIHVADDPAYQSLLDQAVHWLSATFVDMKFYLLFSFLFGYSFQLQIEAAQRAGAGFKPRMLRRLGGLFAIGALHAVFLITGGMIYASGGGNGDTGAVLASVLTAPFLAAAYGATLLRVMHSNKGQDVRRVLAPAGQMALSIYLGQSVATMLIFTGIGLGLVGQVSPLETMGIAGAIFAVQVVLSHVWMSRYGYGPVEGVLRAVTNATAPTWQRKTAGESRRSA